MFAACLSALSLAGVCGEVCCSHVSEDHGIVQDMMQLTHQLKTKNGSTVQAVIQPLNQQLEYIGSSV